MAKIVQLGNPVLRKKAKDVPEREVGGAKIKRIIKEMRGALLKEPDGVGLAAPQVGVSLRMFIVSGGIFRKKEETKRPRDMVFINPSIIKRSRKKELLGEGCLSIRGKYGKVKRSLQVTLKALNEKGELVTIGASGLLSQILQHETDHLDGILFIDKAIQTEEIQETGTQKK
jgi:peptide deformylase